MRGVWLAVPFLVACAAVMGSGCAESIKFGSYVDKKVITLGPGDNGYFEFSFINTGVSDLWVTIETLDSGIVTAKAVPGGLEVSPEGNQGVKKWYLLDDGSTHVPIYYARVYVEAPTTIEPANFHDQTVKVVVRAVSESRNTDETIRENLVQEHDYEFTVKLTDEFYSRLVAPDEEISLSYDRSKTVGVTKKDDSAISDGFSEEVEYVNVSGEKLDLTKTVSGKVLDVRKTGKGADDAGDDNGKEGPGTLAIMLLCLAAIGVAIIA